MFISELGSESSLKLVCDSIGFAGFILREQETKKKTIAPEKNIPFPFIVYC
jgi:hypothetical protein